MNPKHLSESPLWYTPQWIINASHDTIGEIDLDPASDIFGNSRICAKRIITEKEDGLIADWNNANNDPITIFLNPPGGKTISKKSVPVLFWQKLMNFRNTNQLVDAIVVAFSIEQLQTTQNLNNLQSMCDFYCCIPNKRIKFDKNEGKLNSPSHANAIVYVPGRLDRHLIFIKNFNKYGKIIKGV